MDLPAKTGNSGTYLGLNPHSFSITNTNMFSLSNEVAIQSTNKNSFSLQKHHFQEFSQPKAFKGNYVTAHF